MFCPQCGDEFRSGFEVCDQCGVALVHEPPAEPEHPDLQMETVYESADVALLPVIKSVLDGADIPYIIQGDEASGMLPLGRFNAGLFKHGVAGIVRVPAEHAEVARALLVESDDVPTDWADDDEPIEAP